MQFAPAFIVWLYRSGLQAGQNRNTTRQSAFYIHINYIKLYNIISNQSATDKKQSKFFLFWLVLHYLSACGHLYQSQGENATESRKRALFATISKRTRFVQSQSNAQSANNDLLRLYKTTTTQHPTKHTQHKRKQSQRARTGAGSGNGKQSGHTPTSTPSAHAQYIGVTPQAQNRRAGGSRSKIGGIISIQQQLTTQNTPPQKNSPKNFQKKIREIYLLVEKIGVWYRKLPRKHFCFVSIGRKTRQKVLVEKSAQICVFMGKSGYFCRRRNSQIAARI